MQAVDVTLVCENQHQTPTSGIVVEYDEREGTVSFMGGSDWDFCEPCGDAGGDSHRSQASRDVGWAEVMRKFEAGEIRTTTSSQQRTEGNDG